MNLVKVCDEWPQLKDCQWKILWPSISWVSGVFTLELHPSPEVIEKIDDIYLMVSEYKVLLIDNKGIYREDIKVCLDDKTSPSAFKLTKGAGYYSFNLPGTFNGRQCDKTSDVTVRVELVFLKYTLNIISEVDIPPSALGKDLGSLLTFSTQKENSKFTDVEIVVKGKGTSPDPDVCLFAHKAILAARSSVLQKMFEHNFKESATNTITVEDIDAQVFKELLTYVYTETVPNLKSLASPLLVAAEKYQLQRLKAVCEQHLSYSLQVDNAAQTLWLAHTYRADQLKKNTMKFIIEHRDEVRETKDWETIHNCCDLLEELLDTALDCK